MIAIQLERRYSKKEIITMYLNLYDFNYNADGLRSAANIYFSKEPSELLLEESAMLVGMLKNSSLYNPIRRPALVISRRNIVFQQMLRNEMLTQKEVDSLQQLPLEIQFNLNLIVRVLQPISGLIYASLCSTGLKKTPNQMEKNTIFI